MFNSRTLVAAILSGIVGAIANSVAVATGLGVAFLPLVADPGRYLGAIAFALLLPPIFTLTSNVPAWLSAMAALTVIPTLLAKLAFGVDLSWGTTASLNLVYAVAAVLVYRAATPDRNTAEA